VTSETSTNNFWNPWRLAGWGLAASLLILPAVAMTMTSEVQWMVSDFLFMSMMVGCIGVGLELAVRATRNSRYRGGAAVALVTGFLVVWANGAVGIIGNEDNPANLMFFGVIATAIVGSFAVRFKTPGMAWAMAVSGVAQFAVPLAAMAIWSPPIDMDLAKTLLFNCVFAGLWLLSAWLFARADK
jgi:hypothetical protein